MRLALVATMLIAAALGLSACRTIHGEPQAVEPTPRPADECAPSACPPSHDVKYDVVTFRAPKGNGVASFEDVLVSDRAVCPDGKHESGHTGRCVYASDGHCGWERVGCPPQEGRSDQR